MSRKLIHLTSLFAAGAVFVGAAPTLGAHPVEPASASTRVLDMTGSCGSKDMKESKPEEGKKDEAKKADMHKKKGEMKEGSCGAGSCGGKDMKDKKDSKKGEMKEGSCGSKKGEMKHKKHKVSKKGEMKEGSCGSKGKMDEKKDEKKEEKKN